MIWTVRFATTVSVLKNFKRVIDTKDLVEVTPGMIQC